MITITVFKHQDQYRGFRSSGHAGYAEEGSDIICAAVSALTVNAINSIDELTDDAFRRPNRTKDYLELHDLKGHAPRSTSLLLDSLVLGLESIQESYGKKYIKIATKEV